MTNTLLLDPRGRLLWQKSSIPGAEDFRTWLNRGSLEAVTTAFARMVVFGESTELAAIDRQGGHLRVLLHPCNAQDVAAVVEVYGVDPRIEQLPPRQRAVLYLYGKGRQAKQIAAALDVSVSTVETHRARAREFLGIPGADFVRWCFDNRDNLAVGVTRPEHHKRPAHAKPTTIGKSTKGSKTAAQESDPTPNEIAARAAEIRRAREEGGRQ